MLTHPTLDMLRDLGLHGMAKSFQDLDAHGWRRDHGRGMPVRRFVAGKSTDARSKIGTAPDAQSGIR